MDANQRELALAPRYRDLREWVTPRISSHLERNLNGTLPPSARLLYTFSRFRSSKEVRNG
jgi:hypothetical protein